MTYDPKPKIHKRQTNLSIQVIFSAVEKASTIKDNTEGKGDLHPTPK